MITRFEMFWSGKPGMKTYGDVDEAVHRWLVENVDSGKCEIIQMLQSEAGAADDVTITISILYRTAPNKGELR